MKTISQNKKQIKDSDTAYETGYLMGLKRGYSRGYIVGRTYKARCVKKTDDGIKDYEDDLYPQTDLQSGINGMCTNLHCPLYGQLYIKW